MFIETNLANMFLAPEERNVGPWFRSYGAKRIYRIPLLKTSRPAGAKNNRTNGLNLIRLTSIFIRDLPIAVLELKLNQ